mgnify:CR=1 FL=1|jgi:ribosomal protein L16 Arg81 hydroxylase
MSLGLSSLIAPYTVDDFMSAIYEKKWEVFSQIKPAELHDLFTFEDLEQYLFISRPWDSNKHEFKCSKYPGKSFEPNVNSVEDALDLYAQGYTLIIDSVHQRNEKIARICAKLSNEFFCPVQANVYVTPAGEQGFEAHFDSHDVIVLQTEGAKKWTLAELPDNEIIMQGDKYYNEYDQYDAKEIIKQGNSVELHQGDRLYIPRGTVHKAQGTNSLPSLHITFSLFPITWNKLLESVLTDGSINQLELMKTVPNEILFDLDAPKAAEAIKEKLHLAIDSADISSVWRLLYQRDTVLLPGGGIQSILGKDEISLNSILKIRDCAEIFICQQKSGLSVTFAGKQYGIPAHACQFFEFMTDNPKFTVKDLPGDDALSESKILICKWLINHGVAVVESS